MKIIENRWFRRFTEWLLVLSLVIILTFITASIPVKADYNISTSYE